MPNNTRSIAKMSLNSTQPTTIVCECLTAPWNELYIIFDLHIILMLIAFKERPVNDFTVITVLLIVFVFVFRRFVIGPFRVKGNA